VHTVAHVERVLKVVVRIGPVQLPRRKNKLHHVFYVDFRHVDHLQDHVEAVLRHLRERIQINVPAELIEIWRDLRIGVVDEVVDVVCARFQLQP
jgi:hypothetical protein